MSVLVVMLHQDVEEMRGALQQVLNNFSFLRINFPSLYYNLLIVV